MAPPARPLRFSRAMRIKQGRVFRRLRQEGRRVVNGCLILNWSPMRADASSRLGVITSGKLGNAVMRSRARRVLREAFRLHQHDLNQTVDIILVARRSITKKGFAEVESDYLAALRRARLLKEVR